MNRRELLLSISRLPALLLQPHLPEAQPIPPPTMEEQIEELRNLIYLCAFRMGNHETRLTSLEACAQDCRIQEEVHGPV